MTNLMRFRKLFFLLSALVILPGMVSLFLSGLLPSIDFTGGTLWEVALGGDPSPSRIGELFAEVGLSAEVQSSGEDRFLIRTAPLDSARHQELAARLDSEFGSVAEIRFETLGPRLGAELLRKALLAVALAVLATLSYIAYRFRNFAYGAVAILAMFHDTAILLGVFSLLGTLAGVEVGTLFVTAVLTTLSFSVHDTIVVFDRIREIRSREGTRFEEAVNQAVAETLVRSLNNSLTIIFMLTALFVLGGESLRWFVLALLVGTVSGTYSSTFTAAPLLVVWERVTRERNWKGILRLR